MRIAHLIAQHDPFGSIPLLLALLKYRAAGFEEQFVASPVPVPDAATLRATGCPIYTESEPAQVIARLAGADLIHAHCPSARWGAKLLDPLQRAGRPFLFTLYGTNDPPVALPGLCVSTAVSVHQQQSQTESLCRRVEMGVDLAQFTPPAARPERDHVVLTRIGPPQRQAEFFWRAMADVLCRHPEVELRLVGGQGSGSRRVRVVDAHADLAAILAETDLVVAAPQAGEGNNTYGVMAAMAVGLPVVLADTPDMRACAAPEETALLIPNGDAPAMGAAVELLLGDEALRQRLGSAARAAAVERFDVCARVQEYGQIYTSLTVDVRHAEGPVGRLGRAAGLRRWWSALRPGAAQSHDLPLR
jgi:hypothetical protein